MDHDQGDIASSIAIEDRFAKNSYIKQSCLIGPSLPQPVILVVLSDIARARERKDVAKSLRKTFSSANRDLNAFKTVSHLIVVQDNWTAENTLLQTTGELNRDSIQSKYLGIITTTIDGTDTIVWE